MAVDWNQLLTVDCTKAAELFVRHPEHSDTKIQIRGYTIPFAGTQQKYGKLIEFLDKQLLAYVFPEGDRDSMTWSKARDKFGNIAPVRDGKLGEMLLYVLVEAFLGTPLMAYKLKDLSNPNDQVKGADGVFVGEYQGQRALLVGESKIHKELGPAITSAFRSLQRFHDAAGPYANELLISKKYPKERSLSAAELEATLAILNGDHDILVHPVFVSYSLENIAAISAQAATKEDAEDALAKDILRELTEWENKIANQASSFPKPFQVYLDFFFLPLEDSLQLREHFYELLHGHPYEPSAAKKASTEVKKASSKDGAK